MQVTPELIEQITKQVLACMQGTGAVGSDRPKLFVVGEKDQMLCGLKSHP